jgi:hypothetical protein
VSINLLELVEAVTLWAEKKKCPRCGARLVPQHVGSKICALLAEQAQLQAEGYHVLPYRMPELVKALRHFGVEARIGPYLRRRDGGWVCRRKRARYYPLLWMVWVARECFTETGRPRGNLEEWTRTAAEREVALLAMAARLPRRPSWL